MSFLWGHRNPCFGLLVTSPLGFKAKFPLGGGVHDVCSLRFTYGATPANLLMASVVASRCFLHACFSRGRMLDLNGLLTHQRLAYM